MADEETIDYEIRIKAAEALKSLEEIMQTAASVPDAIKQIETATQDLADTFGISFGAAEKEMQDTIKVAASLRDQMEQINEAGGEGLVTLSPYLEALSQVKSPFGEMGDAAGWKAVNDAKRESDSLTKAQVRSEADVAKELNNQLTAQEKLSAAKQAQLDAEYAAHVKIVEAVQQEIAVQEGKETASIIKQREEAANAEQNALLKAAINEREMAAARKENLDLANEELMAVEKEGAAIEEQIKLYGQVSMTQREAASYLQKFTGTEQGKSILSRFFGDYQEAQTVAAQIDTVKKGIIELSTATGTTFPQAAKVFNEQFSQIPGITQQTSTAVRELNDDFKRVPEETEKAVKGIDAVRIALGAIVAMIVFNTIQLIGNFFRSIIDGAKQAELAINGMLNAERVLSDQGIGIKPKDLQDIIDKLQILNPMLSQLQAMDIVSTVSGKLGVALNLNKQQIDQFSQVVAIYAAKNLEFGKSVDETLNDMVNSALSGRVSQGINDMGVKITDLRVKTEAMRIANIKSEEQWNNLSAEQQNYNKFLALSNILMESAQEQQGGIAGKLETIAGSSAEVSKEWSNLTVLLGQIFGPAIVAFLQDIIHFLQGMLDLVKQIQGPLENMAATWTALIKTADEAGISLQSALANPLLLATLLGSGNFLKNFDEAKKKMHELADATDTATGEFKGLGDAAKAVDFSGFIQKIEDIKQATMDAFTDLRTHLLQKLDDINLEYQRKGEDAERDYLRKIEDINRKYDENIADIKKKQHQKALDDEAKYQLQLWELQQRYLMNLEDALHERDARQILRLQRQYEFDKEDLARKHALDKNQRNEDNKAELDDAKQKRDQEAADAKRDYDRKLADQRIAKQRELADLQTWYMRELRDLMTSQQRKMEQLIKGWIDEQKITEANAATVYGILLKYFGPGGMTDQLYAYMVQSLVANTQNAVNALSQIGGGITGTRDMGGSVPTSMGAVGHPRGGGTSTRNRAEGGVVIANQPTNIQFGEAGMEAAMFLPMNKIGRDSGRVDLSGNMGGGSMNGQIVIRMDLSPDLEARVVENSMNGVANVIAQINRSKV